MAEYYKFFDIETSTFWKNHYTFEKESASRKKSLSKAFIDLIIINTIVPVKFMYESYLGKDPEEAVFHLAMQLPREKNSIIEKFTDLDVNISHAMHSQGMLELKNSYCDKTACLQCAVGNYLLNQQKI